MNVFHCLLSVLPSLSLHRSTDRLESVWGFRFEPKSVAFMSPGILGWTFSILWIVMAHSSIPALQFCQLALSGEIFSYFFLYSFYLCCYFRGILGKPASEHIHQAMMSHVWNYSDHMYSSLLPRVHMYFSDVPSPNPRDPGDTIILICKAPCLLFPLRKEFSPELRSQPQERKGNLTFSWLFGNFSSTRNRLSSALVLIELRQEERNPFTLHMLPGKNHHSLNTMEYVGKAKKR